MSEGNLAYGLIGALVAVVCFGGWPFPFFTTSDCSFPLPGTYAVPVSLAPTGDGVFFQWIQCSAILVIGYIAQLAFGATGVPLE